MKKLRMFTAILLALCIAASVIPAFAVEAKPETETEPVRQINNSVIIDDDPTGGYEGDYVVIYNPATSSSTSYSTGTMTNLIETTVNPSVNNAKSPAGAETPFYKIDVDPQLNELAKNAKIEKAAEDTRASYSVGDTKTFSILSQYSPTGSGSVQFKCLYVGQHCYIWTPTSSSNNTYPLDQIDSSFAQMAANEFDSKFDLMQSSFGNHTNGSNGDGKLHMLYYNINDGWEPGQGYVAGFFYQLDISNNGLPILNIDTYPGVYYKNSSGTEYKRMDDTYNTMVHEYQHLINYSNAQLPTWLNECFSAAAEEICYPGSSVVGRIQSWEGYYYSDNDDWLNPPKEFQYQSSNSLHTGYSMYAWSNSLDNTSLLTLYSQVSFFAQYLFTRFGNTIYKQISNKYSSSEVTAITNATGVNCANLVRDFRIAVYANAAESLGTNYGFKPQAGYDPTLYNNVQNPYDLLAPVIFTGSSCSIKGGGAICVKPKNGVYNPPSGANSSLKYFGITITPAVTYEVSATTNNANYGTVSVAGTVITANPAPGYYVESAEVIEGEATFVINGNTITVTPASDCTIRVNFAPKPSYTVNYVASGTAQGSVTAYVNDVITLPGSVTVNPDGWTFIGWLGNTLAETTNKPTYYAPGASYTVNGNATLYALYNRLEGGGGDVVYQLTDHLEDGVNYILVAQSAISGTTGKAVGNTTVKNNQYLSPITITVNSDDTVTATSANLPKVLWKAAGNDANGYSFYNENVGKYMCLDSTGYLIPGTTALAWYYTSAQALDNKVDSEGYYYLSYAEASSSWYSSMPERYTTSTSEAVIKLYAETQSGTTYYTTDPVAATPTYYTVTFKDWNGTVLSTQQVEQGQAATAPADPTRVGYTFTGWDVAFNNVQSDLVVTAQYTINTYTVTFKDWDGTVLKTQTVNYGGAATAPANPTRVGYTFTGWDVAFNNVTSNLVVTAQYQINTYTVTFKDWDGTVLDTQTVNYGGSATAPADPEREGYTFTGWDVDFTNVTSNLVVTAQYEQNAPSQYLKGDVNCDGIVDSADITLAAAYAMSAGSVTAQGIANGDMNGDGVLTAADLSALYGYIQG